MIPSSDVDIVIVYNEDLLDKVVNILMDIPWVRTVKVWDRNPRWRRTFSSSISRRSPRHTPESTAPSLSRTNSTASGSSRRSFSFSKSSSWCSFEFDSRAVREQTQLAVRGRNELRRRRHRRHRVHPRRPCHRRFFHDWMKLHEKEVDAMNASCRRGIGF